MKNKKPNLLIIVPSYLPHMGGIEITIYEIAKGLSKKYNVDVLTPNTYNGKNKEKSDGFNVYRVGKNYKGKISKFANAQYHELKFLRKQLKKGKKYDIVNLIYSFPQSLLSYYLKYIYKVPIVISEHHYGTGSDICDPKENPPLVNWLAGKSMKKADRVTVTGLTQKKYVKKYAKNIKPLTIASGINTSRYKIIKEDKKFKKRFEDKSPIIFSIGRFNQRKNFKELVLSIKIVTKKYPNALLIIGGKGEEYENIEKLIQKENLEKNIRLEGFVSDEDVIKFYNFSDIFAYTSKFEGFGLIYLEALACGTPVVSYDILAAKDVMKGCKNAFLCKQTPESMGEKIIEVLKKNISNKKRKEESKMIQNKYSWKVNIDSYDKLFKEILNER